MNMWYVCGSWPAFFIRSLKSLLVFSLYNLSDWLVRSRRFRSNSPRSFSGGGATAALTQTISPTKSYGAEFKLPVRR